MESLYTALREWNKRENSFTKLQHTYVAIIVAMLVAAGIIGLINYSLGQSILFVTVAAVLVFIANGVVWALLSAFVTPRLSKSASRASKK